MANHVEGVHHRVFGIRIGILSEDKTQLVEERKHVQVQTGLYSEVSYAVLNENGKVISVNKPKGVIESCDQLQRNLVLKTHHGLVSLRISQITDIRQTDTVLVKPGCKPEDVPENGEFQESSTTTP